QVNFWLNLRFTWRDRAASAGPRALLVRWARFHGAVAGTAVLNMAVFALASTELPHLVAAALGIGVAAVANFVTGDRFVFRAGVADRPIPTGELLMATTVEVTADVPEEAALPAAPRRPAPWWQRDSHGELLRG